MTLIAIAGLFEAAHIAGEIVLGAAGGLMFVAVCWHLWTRGD